ncbi:acetylcholine receptor subunit alpha-1-A-like [Mytilus trossulus]|uniref:acetylcholine receptor subunit alpha-1-A-like n=1 Tax=Mytilus trossulus TaxID=6551 RepID=UPI003004DD78
MEFSNNRKASCKFVILCVCFLSLTDATSFVDMDSLYNTLTSGHNKHLRPEVDLSSSTVISIDFYILNLQDVNEVDGTVSITGYFNIQWTDNNMVWTPADHGNAEYIVLPENVIWKPPLINSNSAQEMAMFGMEDLSLYVRYNGQVTWLPGQNLKFTCSFDITYFPFDTQKCTLLIITWGHVAQDIVFNALNSTIQTALYSINSEWELSNTSVTVDTTGTPMTSFTFHFKRRPLYLTMTLILPCVFLVLLNIGVFLLPTESGERIGFAVTLLLAVVLYLTIAQGLLPATALPRISAICVFLMIDFMMSGLIVGSVIVSSRFYFKSEDEPIPNWIKKIVTFQLCCRAKNRVHDGQSTGTGRHEDKDEALFRKEKVDDSHRNEKEITWQDVSRSFDYISLISYMMMFIGSNLMFIIDVVQGTS